MRNHHGPEHRAATPPRLLCLAGLFLGLIATSCSDLLLDEMSRIASEANRPDISPAAGSVITAHEDIVLSFHSKMSGSTVTLSGTIGSGSETWDTSGATEDALTLNAERAVSWSAGAMRKLVVTVAGGGESVSYEYSFTVFNGSCVVHAADPTETAANAGTFGHPYFVVQSGIDAASALYIVGEGLASAEVRVGKGSFQADYAGSGSHKPVASLKDKILLRGGWSASFSSRDSVANESILEDTSTGDWGGTMNRAVELLGSIGSCAVDGFTVLPGTGTNNCGIHVGTDASASFTGLKIEGRSGSSTSTLCGIYLDAASSTTTSVGIASSQVFTTWIGANTPAASIGIQVLSHDNRTETIESSSISGGRGGDTTGIYCSGLSTLIQDNPLISGGTCASTSGTSVAIYCDYGTATISGNTLDAGANANAGKAYGIQIAQAGSATNPAISGNTFGSSGLSTTKSYAIYETSAANCDPSSVGSNHFDTFFQNQTLLDIGFYCDEGATKIINLTTSVSLQGATNTLAFFSNACP